MMGALSLLVAILTLLRFSHASSIYQKLQNTVAIKETEDIANVQFPFRPNPCYAQVNNFDEAAKQINTTMMDERSCYTTQGRFGSCMAVRSCSPTSKLSNLETWSVIIQIACSYTVKDGKQIHGLCCPIPVAINHSGLSNDIQITPLVIMPYPVILYPSLAASVVPTLPVETTVSSPLTEKQVAIELKQISCGVGPTKILSLEEDRVVGGTDAVKNSWPYAVLLKQAGRFKCGGSLISSNRVLTAAHCVDFSWPWEHLFLTVELGLHVLSPSDALVSRKVFRVMRHRDYDPNTIINDIAILVLKFPVKYVTAISPVCLPAPGTTDTFVDLEAAIIGWGSMQDQYGPLPQVLQQATIKIISNAECQASYDNLQVTIADSMICAIIPGKGSCFGDSGGPLLVKSSPTEPWTEVGIVSFGVECASPDYPTVYTRVSSFSSWISQRI
ncbi:trypsin-1-like [Daphnia carinata]|uniref:trypsin-1-like n=1 Tax=Daphnia carinata TaxID=120202 RepID=UPI00257C0537|nr:trypsin-1-like [Daphnia carinata]